MLTSNQRIKNSQNRFVRISSEDKVIGTNSQFTINLESAGGSIDNVKGFIVHSIECPNVFNNVASYNNRLIISFPGPATETDIDINLPVGYYLIDDFINMVNQVVAAQILANGDAYTFVLSKVGVFPNEIIAFDVNGVSTGSCALFTSDTSVLPTMGVESTPNAVLPNIPFTITNGITAFAQSIPNLIGETAVYVHSRTLCPLNLSEGTGTFSVVDKLNLNEPFGSVSYSNFNNDITHQKSYFPFESRKTLRKIDITLRNRTGQVLQLPPNFNFTMMIKIFHT